MPRLTFKAAAPPCSLELRPGVNRLGRAEGNDFSINHPTVSSFHCEVIVEGETVRVRDCGATNGTFIDGQRVTEAPLALDQTLRLGDVELVLQPPLPTVAIPHVDFALPPPPPPLADGSPACRNHAGRRADYECTRCHRTFCAACIRELHRVGGRSYKFCPTCSGPCRLLAPVEQVRKWSWRWWLRWFQRGGKTPS